MTIKEFIYGTIDQYITRLKQDAMGVDWGWSRQTRLT